MTPSAQSVVVGHQGRDTGRAEIVDVARRQRRAPQRGSTSTMIFSMAKCISYVSQFMTLLPGDIITTGTRPASAPA